MIDYTKMYFPYTFGFGLAAVCFHTLWPVRYHHREWLDIEPPFMIVANHTSFFDPMIIGYGVKKHPVVFLGKRELNRSRFFRIISGWARMIPVSRGQYDMEAMRSCSKVLKENGILGIFPEGTRFHEGVMQEIQDGFAVLAFRGRVPIVPIYISGRCRPFRKVHAMVGKPVPYDDLLEQGMNRDTIAELVRRIKECYVELIQEVKDL